MEQVKFRLAGTLAAVLLALLLKPSVRGVNGQGQSDHCPLGAAIGDSCEDGAGICAPPGHRAEHGPKGRLRCYATNCATNNVTLCLDIHDADHGYYLPNDLSNIGVNATASLHCCDGYKTTGDKLICGEDGQWSAPNATCEPFLTLCLDIHDADHGYYLPNDLSNIGVNATASLHCCEGYKTTGDKLICGEDGQWSAPNATCEPFLTLCLDIHDADHGYYLPNDLSNIGVNATASLHCCEGYKTTGDKLICGEDGQWSTPNATCEPFLTLCLDIHDADHGYYLPNDLSNIGVNATASLHCCEGYKTTGDKLICGEDGQWSAPNATCEPICCGHPRTITYAQGEGVGECFMDVVTYNCDQSSNVAGGRPLSVCLANGSWSDTGFYCENVP